MAPAVAVENVTSTEKDPLMGMSTPAVPTISTLSVPCRRAR